MNSDISAYKKQHFLQFEKSFCLILLFTVSIHTLYFIFSAHLSLCWFQERSLPPAIGSPKFHPSFNSYWKWFRSWHVTTTAWLLKVGTLRSGVPTGAWLSCVKCKDNFLSLHVVRMSTASTCKVELSSLLAWMFTPEIIMTPLSKMLQMNPFRSCYSLPGICLWIFATICLSQIVLLKQNTIVIVWMADKNQKLMFHYSGGWNYKVRGPTYLGSSEDLLLGCKQKSSWYVLIWQRFSYVVPFERALIPFMKAPLSWPNHPPKAPSPNTMSRGLEFPHVNLEVTLTCSPVHKLNQNTAHLIQHFFEEYGILWIREG